ncbi:MAG: DUF6436 domain-containing protein [Pseudomonadota bacterium]
MMHKQSLKIVVAWSILILWTSFTAYFSWLKFYKHQGLFSQQEPTHQLRQARVNIEKLIPVFYHFIDEACSCSKFSLPHIETLMNRYTQVQHIKVESGDTRWQSLPWLSDIVASPSVAIFNSGGGLTYFGPYTDGAVCGEGLDLVDIALDKSKNDPAFQWINYVSFGCYCPWKT